MDETVKFDRVVAYEFQEEMSYAVCCGSLAGVIGNRQEDSDLQVRLLLGLVRPASGTVSVFGQDPGLVPEKMLNGLRRRIAVVYPTGGLISNLKVWENLVLPLEYHGGCGDKEIDERGVAALARVEYTGALMELPGHLSLYHRRQVALARAMLIEPELLVYNAMLDGLSRSEQEVLRCAAVAFHRENDRRISIFLTTNQESIKEIPLDSRILIKGSTAAHD